ncbi:6,7-dimethyl-8-ribityllumazine synthase [Candidatus Uhrbacteria bacterium]|nr:6,7-dimethyl-8-ribityllumazine synthase [Candidatus Uhrbacteria bacterium]
MKRIAIVLGSFHKKEADQMLMAAREEAAKHELEIVEEVWVPGSIEKPLALKRLLLRDDIDGAAVLGIIERGETKHGLVMGQVVYDAIIKLQLEFMKPIGLGILGPEILPEQIPPRLDGYARAAVAATAKMLE